MDFFEAIERRRSIRRYTSKAVPPEVIHKALDAALLAPNSSNMQTWEFFWPRSAAMKAKVVELCLNQSAARNAQELIVITASPHLAGKNSKEMVELLKKTNEPKVRLDYYSKLMPFAYGFHWLTPLKWFLIQSVALFRPIPRNPWNFRDVQEVCIKSAALACENFMLAVTAQGFDTCAMEGFDESRLRRALKMKCGTRIVMVVSVGESAPDASIGPRVRFDRRRFIHEI